VWQIARASTPAQLTTMMERIKRKGEKEWEQVA
jgi:hypothetical protein